MRIPIWKLAMLLVIMVPFLPTCGVFAEEQSLGRVRIASFVCPRQVAPNSVFSVDLDLEYEVRTNASIRAAIFGDSANASALWQSDVTIVSGGGDKVWTVNLKAPAAESTIRLSAYAYYLDNGTWKFYNDTILGPGLRQEFIKVAPNAALQVELGVPGLKFTLGNLSETTMETGGAEAVLPVGVAYALSIPPVVEYHNATRLIFNRWGDGNNQTRRIITLDGDTQLVGSYRTQYLLRVSSTLSEYSFEKWYDAGSTVTLRQFDSVPMVWPLGLFGARYVFSGWSGDVNSRSSGINFTMDTPKSIDANFTVDFGFLPVIVVIIVSGIIGEAVLLALRRKKTAGSKANLSKSKHVCPNCGGMVEKGWVNCINCGTKLDSSESETASHRDGS
jgi:hypothetical protein